METTQVKSSISVGKFNGALSAFQVAAYGDLVRAGVEKPVAHKIAMDYGSDLGRLMASDAKLKSKVSAAKDDGRSRITISGGGLVTTQRSMSVVRVAQQMSSLFEEGLLKSRQLPELAENLAEYLADCESWASEQTWS